MTTTEVTDEEMKKALNEIIQELKEKYGDDWLNHIGEGEEYDDADNGSD